jgi:hypothetical protein
MPKEVDYFINPRPEPCFSSARRSGMVVEVRRLTSSDVVAQLEY